MGGLYGAQMVHRWYELIAPYADGEKKLRKILYHTQMV